MRRFEAPEQLPPALRMTRTYVFPGGCVTYRFEFGPDGDSSLIHDVDAALAFQPRVDLVARGRRPFGWSQSVRCRRAAVRRGVRS